MRFLKKGNVPDELPDLAIESARVSVTKIPASAPKPISVDEAPAVKAIPDIPVEDLRSVAGEDYLEFSEVAAPVERVKTEDIREKISEEMLNEGGENTHPSFFNQFLEDLNDEIKDYGKLEEWYQNKFLPQDVVSNMKCYWEDNKAEIIIRNFGKEYKDKINVKIAKMRKLEMDWRAIYFDLIKKEEEMKKEERELKGILSEFVDLCRRRKSESVEDGEKKEK